jgi:hypothetical protein
LPSPNAGGERTVVSDAVRPKAASNANALLRAPRPHVTVTFSFRYPTLPDDTPATGPFHH